MLNEKWPLSRAAKCKDILFWNSNHVVKMLFVLRSILGFTHCRPFLIPVVFLGILRTKTTTTKMSRYFSSTTIYSNGTIVFPFFLKLFLLRDDDWCMALHHNMCIRTALKYDQNCIDFFKFKYPTTDRFFLRLL